VQEAVNRIIQETDAVNLVGEAGLPCDRGFLVEFGDRIVSKLLPTVRK
jgi:site-specific recombinase